MIRDILSVMKKELKETLTITLSGGHLFSSIVLISIFGLFLRFWRPEGTSTHNFCLETGTESLSLFAVCNGRFFLWSCIRGVIIWSR